MFTLRSRLKPSFACLLAVHASKAPTRNILTSLEVISKPLGKLGTVLILRTSGYTNLFLGQPL